MVDEKMICVGKKGKADDNGWIKNSSMISRLDDTESVIRYGRI
jgi:hypothetical protein